jgi:glycosyltransferase involved in cell wall biosynthesis
MPRLSSLDCDKRVLMVISVLARGDCERQLYATTRGLLERGYEIEIFTLADVPAELSSLEPEFRKLGITITCAREFGDISQMAAPVTNLYGLEAFAPIFGQLNFVLLGSALGQVIKRFQPGVVHCWSEPSSVIGGFVATALEVPRVIVQFVNVPRPQQELAGSELYREAYRSLVRRASLRMFNISVANARSFEDWLEVPRGTVELLRNGFMPDSLSIRDKQQARIIRRQFGIPADAPAVGSIMRFSPEKDPDLWLDTAALIAATRPDVHFILAGYGSLAAWIESRVRELRLSERFILPGPAIDTGAIYACMDVFLMTSKFEGTPNTLVEAQAAGIPVVTPAVGGTMETIHDGLTGLLAEGRTARQIADSVLRILDDPTWPQRAAENGPRFVSQHFDWQRKIDCTIAFYRRDRSRLRRGIDRVMAIVGSWRCASQ